MRFSNDSDVPTDEYVMTIIASIAESFTSSENARNAIIRRVLQRLIDDPDLVSGDPYHDLFPIVRYVAFDHFGIGGHDVGETRTKLGDLSPDTQQKEPTYTVKRRT